MSNTEKVKSALYRNGMSVFFRPMRFSLIVCTFFLLVGCATDPKKTSPVFSQAAQLRKVLLEMTKAYEQKDEKAFFARIDPSFHLLTLFKDQVNRDFEGFSDADIQVTIEQIRIEHGFLVTALRWKGDWTSVSGVSGGTPLRKRGHAVFRWTSNENLRLLEIKGNPPFGVF